MITTAKAALLEQNPIAGSLDFHYYKSIHKYLFGDIYSWAGEVRTVNMSKKGTEFVKAEELEAVADKAFQRLQQKEYFTNESRAEFIDDVVDFYCVTNMLHPFREGNGRTQRSYFTQLISNAGYRIDFSEIDTDALMIATIQAAQGVRDNLTSLFECAIKDK